MTTVQSSGRAQFEDAIQAFESEIANIGVHLSIDAAARQVYAQRIAAMAGDLRAQVANGQMTWTAAAQQAQETRNAIMEIMRDRSTSIGRSWAEWMKRDGKTLNGLIAENTNKLYGPGASFYRLSSSQQDAVYANIVKSAGSSRPNVTMLMNRLAPAGRALIILSIALSIYEVVTANDKASAAMRESTVTTAGIGGGIAGGALAGLACGPAAPACVTAGAFAGGALAALGTSFFW